MFAFAFLCAFLLLILYDYLRKRHGYYLMSRVDIPGQSPWPIIGNTLQLIGLNSENVHEFINKHTSNRWKACYFWNFNRLQIISRNIKDIEFLLSSTHLHEKTYTPVASKWLGYGLVMSTGQKWHQRRKIITPTFHFKILEQFVEIFDRQSDILAGKFQTFADGNTVVDVYPYVGLAALDIIAETAMGVTVGAQENDSFGYVEAVRETTELLFERLRSPVQSNHWLYRLLYPNKHKRFYNNIEFMKSFTKDVINERRNILTRDLKKQQSTEENEEDVGVKKRAALLDVLLQATVNGQPLTDEDICEEVDTFMFAGQDTSTSGISFTLYLISQHAEVQRRLFTEIRDVIGDDKQRPVNLRDLHELKYLECVIKESLRMYPPVPIIGRLLTEETEINGRIFPAGTNITVPIYNMLHDEDNFKNPEVFNPERFSTDNEHKIETFSYISFSAGPRNCIGQKYAMLELKSAITKILRHFELLPSNEKIVMSISITLKSTTGINLRLKPRIY